MIQPEKSEMQQIVEMISGFVVLCVIVGFFALSAGVVTFETKHETPITPEPTFTPLSTPRPITTPTPEPTPDWSGCGLQDNCYKLRQQHIYFRQNANNFGEDLTVYATVYGYKILPNFHYHDPLWGTRAYFKTTPSSGNVFLFVFVNVYAEGYPNDARQYGVQRHQFMLQVRDKLYYPEEPEYPQNPIKEFDEVWNYAHTDSIIPYGYTIVQERGTGIISAVPQDYLIGGRSNAQDGWIQYEIPYDTDLNVVRVAATFNNVGGNAFWKLV